MATVKTAISIEESLFNQAEKLSRRLDISRSRLFALAIRELLNKHHRRDLIERINNAQQDFPDGEDKAFLEMASRSFAELGRADEW